MMNNKSNGNGQVEPEKQLWAAADQLWANSPLRLSEYSTPVPGLILLRFADNSFTKVKAELKGKATGRRTIGKTEYQAIRGFPMLKPAGHIVRSFNSLVEPTFDLIRNLQRKNQVLRHTRDLLLPKLISSALDVSRLEMETA